MKQKEERNLTGVTRESIGKKERSKPERRKVK